MTGLWGGAWASESEFRSEDKNMEEEARPTRGVRMFGARILIEFKTEGVRT